MAHRPRRRPRRSFSGDALALAFAIGFSAGVFAVGFLVWLTLQIAGGLDRILPFGTPSPIP